MKKALEKQLNKFDDKTDKLIVKVLEEQNIPPAFIAVICADVKTLNEQFLTDFYHKIREEERKEIVEIIEEIDKSYIAGGSDGLQGHIACQKIIKTIK